MIADILKGGKSLAWSWQEVLDALVAPCIVILVAVTAFGLGRLSALSEQQGSLIIHNVPSGQPQ